MQPHGAVRARPGDLAEFLAAEQVEITASLPCYLEDNVEEQRGKGVYADSIRAIRLLNELGYGRDPALCLNLVYNPVGAVLPPPQQALQADYRRELGARFDIRFDQLFTITNMPISRFGAVLLAQGEYVRYMQLLRDNFSAANLDTVMCRNLLSIDWQGYVYDCDFNQMLDLPILASDRQRHISGLLPGAPWRAGHPYRRTLLRLRRRAAAAAAVHWRRNGRHCGLCIPVLNEQARIAGQLAYLRAQFPGCELTVVDGGSVDRTVAVALPLCTRLLLGGRSRGADEPRGRATDTDYLCFLHADSLPG